MSPADKLILRQVFNRIHLFRRTLARWIAPRDELFSSDMSLIIDRLTLEVESLRSQLLGAR